MIFIPRKLLILQVSLSIIAIGLFGGAAYALFSPERGFSPLQLKMVAEWFLFAAVVVISLDVLILLRILQVRVRIKNELRRIQSMSNYVSLSSQLNSRKLYELAPLLSTLFQQVSRINERQSLKMGSQNTLLTFLISNISYPLVITDLFGKILFLSTEFEEKFKKDHMKLLGTNIENLIPNVFIQLIVEHINTEQNYKKEQKDDESFTVYPVYNREQEIAYIVFDFRLSSHFTSTAGTGPQGSRPHMVEQAFSSQWKKISNTLHRFTVRKGK